MIKTNDFGHKFLERWMSIGDFQILGEERTDTSKSRGEFFLIYKSKGSVKVLSLPEEGSRDNGCCFFGDFDYFSMVYAADMTDSTLRLRGGDLVHPIWYMGEAAYERWRRAYLSIRDKYSEFLA